MLAFAVMLAALATAQPAATPAPVDVYRSALKRLAALQQPAYIDTTMDWKVLARTPQGDQPAEFDERVLFDSTQRRECVLFVPYTSDSSVIIGQSYFAPDVWLIHRRLAETAAQQAASPAPNFAPDLSDLKTIASVVSVAKPSYKIQYAGTDKLTNGGGEAYHLKLDPLSEPAKHNLRELWVSATTGNIVRAVLVGDYRPDPQSLLEQTTVSEDFGPVGPYWMVIHHTWSYRDAPDGITFQYDVTAKNMSFPATIPAWYFDERQFAHHRSEVNASLQWP
jgi:hypothetical protein